MVAVSRVFIPKFGQALLGVALATLCAGAAVGGNLTVGTDDPAVVGPERLSDDVSAFYLGISGGYANGGSDRFGLRTSGGTFAVGELETSGGFGGVRGGWRGVLPAIGGRDYVYGFEVGYDFGSLEDSTQSNISGTVVGAGSEISDVLSIKLRNGLTNRSRSILYFVSVGYVSGDISTSSSITSGTSTQTSVDNDRRSGFSASIGAEHQLTDRWSITGEYEYVQFDSKQIDFSSGFSTKSTPNYRNLRFGLNYRF